MIGVDDAKTSTELLSEGFSYALDPQHALLELAAGLLKLERTCEEHSVATPRWTLMLDLFTATPWLLDAWRSRSSGGRPTRILLAATRSGCAAGAMARRSE